MSDTKCMKKRKAHNRRRNVRKKHHKSLNKRKRTIQIFFGISVFIIIVVVLIVGLIFLRDKYVSQIGKIDNGAYHQEGREVSINELFEKNDVAILPCFNWYQEIENASCDQKINYYKNQINAQVNREDIRMSKTLDSLSIEDREEWDKLFAQIDNEEEKKGENENVADNEVLSSIEYWDNSSLRFKAYCILPESTMANQYARNAGDALTVLIGKESNKYESRSTALKYGKRAYGGYICLFGFMDNKNTMADICYWIADIFVQYLVHAEFLTDSEREHCAWMAYVYSYKGLLWADTEAGVQHRSDLEEANKLAKKILINEFGCAGLIE